jgi:hypothetical protein
MATPPAPTNRPGNLFEPVQAEFEAHGIFDDTAKSSSAQFWLTTHKRWLALAAGSVAGAGALLRRRARTRI